MTVLFVLSSYSQKQMFAVASNLFFFFFFLLQESFLHLVFRHFSCSFAVVFFPRIVIVYMLALNCLYLICVTFS